MQNEITDLLQVITQNINKTINEIQELSNKKLHKQNSTWEDVMQLSELKKGLSQILKQSK